MKVESLTVENEQLRAHNKSLSKEISELKNSYQSLKSELDSCENFKLRNETDKRKELEEIIRKVKNEKVTFENENIMLKNENLRLKHEISTIKAQEYEETIQVLRNRIPVLQELNFQQIGQIKVIEIIQIEIISLNKILFLSK